ncbi:hypothetical protein NBRC116188_18520 [Oceaniserpentilla sp. 4NH20-0058]|uniref:hypothetical protein n=1 Tax=Oceaniserpentilla sp. 4NH20-0058 TaxID=3127660 RepID=UPI003101E28F
MKLVLHIGSGKTGTSSIQKKLKDSKKSGKLKSFIYTGLFFEEVPECDVDMSGRLPQHFFTEMRGRKEDELIDLTLGCLQTIKSVYEKKGIDTIIWSNESLYRSTSFFANLIPLISPLFDLEVVLYLRRQDKWFVSSYEQWNIKHKTYSGKYKNFDEWFASNSNRGSHEKNLITWEKMVGKQNFKVHAYDEIDNVVDHFLNSVDIKLTDSLQITNKSRVNTQQPKALLSIYELYSSVSLNSQLPVEVNKLLQNIPVNQIEYESATIKGLSDVNINAGILDVFEEENKRISERYNIPFSKKYWDLEQINKTSGSASVESILAVMVRILVEQNNRITELESKLNN